MFRSKQTIDRAEQIEKCSYEGDVLILDYGTFKHLVREYKGIQKKSHEICRKWLLDSVHGPSLVILDDVILLDFSYITEISHMKTARKIILTNEPLHECPSEYDWILQFISENPTVIYDKGITTQSISFSLGDSNCFVYQWQDYPTQPSFIPEKYMITLKIPMSSMQARLFHVSQFLVFRG